MTVSSVSKGQFSNEIYTFFFFLKERHVDLLSYVLFFPQNLYVLSHFPVYLSGRFVSPYRCNSLIFMLFNELANAPALRYFIKK